MEANNVTKAQEKKEVKAKTKVKGKSEIKAKEADKTKAQEKKKQVKPVEYVQIYNNMPSGWLMPKWFLNCVLESNGDELLSDNVLFSTKGRVAAKTSVVVKKEYFIKFAKTNKHFNHLLTNKCLLVMGKDDTPNKYEWVHATHKLKPAEGDFKGKKSMSFINEQLVTIDLSRTKQVTL